MFFWEIIKTEKFRYLLQILNRYFQRIIFSLLTYSCLDKYGNYNPKLLDS